MNGRGRSTDGKPQRPRSEADRKGDACTRIAEGLRLSSGSGCAMPLQRTNYRRSTYVFPDDFPQRLERFQEESGLSRAEIARRIGTNHPYTTMADPPVLRCPDHRPSIGV